MMLAALAVLAVLQAPPGEGVRLADLMGLSPADVAGAIGGTSPSTDHALHLSEGGRIVDIYPGGVFHAPSPEGQACATAIVVPDETGRHALTDFPTSIGVDRYAVSFRGRFVFEDGRLRGIRWMESRAANAQKPEERSPMDRAIQQQALNGWSAQPGRLPLSADTDFSTGVSALDGRERVVTACRPYLRYVPTGDRPFDDAGFIQGLALLPFAVGLPALNAERDRAAREGPVLMAQLEPGRAIPGGPSAFVRGRRGVRLYRDPEDLDYGVIVISHGWDRRDNLSRYNDVGMVGVRGHRVVWKAGPSITDALGLRQAMCVNAQARVAQARPGCSNTGIFTFGD